MFYLEKRRRWEDLRDFEEVGDGFLTAVHGIGRWKEWA